MGHSEPFFMFDILTFVEMAAWGKLYTLGKACEAPDIVWKLFANLTLLKVIPINISATFDVSISAQSL